MHYTEWVEDEGVHESLASLRIPLSPILRVRAVKNSRGSYDAVVRDFGGRGIMLASRIDLTLENAKSKAIELSKKVVQEALNDNL